MDGPYPQAGAVCENIAAILKDKNAVLLEVGPGKVLGTLAKRHADMDGQGIVFPCATRIRTLRTARR